MIGNTPHNKALSNKDLLNKFWNNVAKKVCNINIVDNSRELEVKKLKKQFTKNSIKLKKNDMYSRD